MSLRVRPTVVRRKGLGAFPTSPGETLGSVNVQAAARTLLAALPTPVASKPVLACIDGPSASGKSTLAAAVARAAEQVTLVHGDDFYGPEQRDWRSWTAEEGYLRVAQLVDLASLVPEHRTQP